LPPPLRIDIVFSGLPMVPRLESVAMEEAASIWSPYNVDLHEGHVNEMPDDMTIRLVVILAPRQDQHVPSAALGSIRFRGERPESAILMYPHTIDQIVSECPQAQRDRGWPAAYHDVLAGRVLGRALAHEIGHFLLRSRYHASSGLMRAIHRSADLVALERQGFDLSNGEVARILDVNSALLH
jgi:hypothetical protein